MLVAIEDVRDVPVVRARRSRHGFAVLDVLAVDQLVRAAADVRACRRTTHDADARCNVLPAAAADLVADDPADHTADDGARYVHAAGGAVVDQRWLHPAA